MPALNSEPGTCSPGTASCCVDSREWLTLQWSFPAFLQLPFRNTDIDSEEEQEQPGFRTALCVPGGTEAVLCAHWLIGADTASAPVGLVAKVGVSGFVHSSLGARAGMCWINVTLLGAWHHLFAFDAHQPKGVIHLWAWITQTGWIFPGFQSEFSEETRLCTLGQSSWRRAWSSGGCEGPAHPSQGLRPRSTLGSTAFRCNVLLPRAMRSDRGWAVPLLSLVVAFPLPRLNQSLIYWECTMWLSSVLDTGDTAGKKRDKAYPSWGLPSSGEDRSKQT